MSAPGAAAPLLVVDSGSPVVSVAVGSIAGGVRAERAVEIEHSSEALLRLIDAVLTDGAIDDRRPAGLVGLTGPGSFTGLRVGLATLLGLHQATGIPATGVSTFSVLATIGVESAGTVAAVVDALRDEWFVQTFEAGRPTSEPQIVSVEALAALEAARIVGHDVTRKLSKRLPGPRLTDAGTLAARAFEVLSTAPADWRPERLIEPLYLRPPAARRS